MLSNSWRATRALSQNSLKMYQTCTLPFPVTSDRDIPDKSTDPKEKYLRNVSLFWQVSARDQTGISLTNQTIPKKNSLEMYHFSRPVTPDRDIPDKSSDPKGKYLRNVSLFARARKYLRNVSLFWQVTRF